MTRRCFLAALGIGLALSPALLYCFEWEKKWHPEIEEPGIAFPHYAKTMAEYLTAAGVKAS